MTPLEDKRVCPHCGRKLYNRPYLMSRGGDLVFSVGVRRCAYTLLGCLFAIGLLLAVVH